jgi:hypothetical protein
MYVRRTINFLICGAALSAIAVGFMNCSGFQSSGEGFVESRSEPPIDNEPPVNSGPEVLKILTLNVDRPTLHVLGVQVLIEGDNNQNATIAVRVRRVGTPTWRQAPNLFRVVPSTVAAPVQHQFSGSIFDLSPDTEYDVELLPSDPDGRVAAVQPVKMRTRPIPRQNPLSPREVMVSNVTELRAAFTAATAGTVIVLRDGVYQGSFFGLFASGTAENPIVLRGQTKTGAILDGNGCTDCNVLEVYGSYVHVENLTVRNAFRAIRFQGNGTRNNVARQLNITNVIHGIAAGTDQLDFYMCDNDVDGRLRWPDVYFNPNANLNWDDRGISIHGWGHVVCHNRLRGFGDAMLNLKDMARSIDFYGNDVLDTFDGNELDHSSGNSRSFHNRFTNVATTVSLQPIFGGPAYVLRNVGRNIPDDTIKFKSADGKEPSGVLIYHNSLVSARRALNLQTPITGRSFAVKNNLFVGPRTPSGRTVEWTAGVEFGQFDYNGYFPDGSIWLGTIRGTPQLFNNFLGLKQSGVFESNGRLLTSTIFANGMVGPVGDGSVVQLPGDFSLASMSSALSGGERIPGINDASTAPDLGAVEFGCPVPVYGPRPMAAEGTVALINCAPR